MSIEKVLAHLPGTFTQGEQRRGPCFMDDHKDKQCLAVTQKDDAVLIWCHSCERSPDEHDLKQVGLEKKDLRNGNGQSLPKPPKQEPKSDPQAEMLLQEVLAACDPLDSNHKYIKGKMLEGKINNLWVLKRKYVKSILDEHQGLSFSTTGDVLVLPGYIGGKIVNCRFIDENGTKRSLKGIKTKGDYWASKKMNGKPPDCIYIGEGMATVQTAIMIKGCNNTYGVASNGTGNLEHTCTAMRESYPEAEIYLLGELDSKTSQIVDKYRDYAQKIGARLVVPEFSPSVEMGTDLNDVYVHEQKISGDGKEAVIECFDKAEYYGKEEITASTIIESLESRMLSKEEMDEFENPDFIIENLVVRSHILTINAMPGGGKTSIIRHFCPEMVEAGYKVIYINSDISGNDAKKPHQHAENHGYTLLLPTLSPGDGKRSAQQIIIDDIERLTELKGRNNNIIIIFDTLKKFTSMMDKKLCSAFYTLQRELSGRGITIINLAHANKYRDGEGNIIPEGTGDHVADVDDQIIFEHWEDNGVVTVTTGKGVRVRFAHEPMSFEVSDCGWSVKKLDEIVDVVQLRKEAKDNSQENTREEKDTEVVSNIKTYIESLSEAPYEKMIVDYCHMKYGYNPKKTRLALWNYCNENQDAIAVHWRYIKKKTLSGKEGKHYFTM